MQYSLNDYLNSEEVRKKMLKEDVKNGCGNIAAIAENESWSIQVIEQNDYLVILAYDLVKGGRPSDRAFPLNGFDINARQQIADDVLASYEAMMPPDWEKIITKHNAGVWYHDACDVRVMHP